ncbi:unnamed protein product [Parascedosporium putredinis]|uniref:tRNA (adenine(58)-N(1))-methyltransferase non-catalytic subunit TRM6 n=1 Tax=Parascedosporium putredinis TaxID=1442378 RepID=A0A9P1H7F1_9PEZI|nr:unnamed protein product [Parascedosporium putredinis]CAI7999783.1 unnamed protein product [Parascedosporium putredinis]
MSTAPRTSRRPSPPSKLACPQYPASRADGWQVVGCRRYRRLAGRCHGGEDGHITPRRSTKLTQARGAKPNATETATTSAPEEDKKEPEAAVADQDVEMADTTTATAPETDAPAPTTTTEATADAADGETATAKDKAEKSRPRHYDRDDLEIPYAGCNTMTLLHSNSQPNLSFLKYYDFDFAAPNPLRPPPLAHQPPLAQLAAAPRARAGRHLRRRARPRFSGLVTASTLDPVSLLKHTLPLLSPGAPIAIYSQSVEALTQLADCFSVARRAAWITDPPRETDGLSPEELERWPGSEDFPVNPTLLLGTTVQTSRVRQWQVLPGRTHPLMTGRGGSEGYIFTAWKALPATGKVEARGGIRGRRLLPQCRRRRQRPRRDSRGCVG